MTTAPPVGGPTLDAKRRLMTRTTWTVFTALTLVAGSAIVACSPNGEQRTAGSSAVPAEELPNLAAQFADAVWRVETDGCGWLGTGSAFAVDAHHLVTNHHVISNDSSPNLRSRSGQLLVGRVIGALERPDVAVIEVSENLTTMVEWAPTEDLRQAEPIVVMGYPTPDRIFAMTTGEIVTFQPPAGREALLSNAPVDRGNSGGPALRRDGTVAGVVTQMATDDPSGRVIAVAFTASNAQRTVEGFIDDPNENVESRCGQGPDYVAPAPADFAIPPPKDIPAEPSQPTPPQGYATPTQPRTPPSTAPTAPTTTIACPSGDVSIAITEVAPTAVPDEPGWWEVRVSGVIRNDSPADIAVVRIDVTIDGDPPRGTEGFPDVTSLASGRSTAWETGNFIFSPDHEPTAATVRLDWRWVTAAHGSCAPSAASDEAS